MVLPKTNSYYINDFQVDLTQDQHNSLLLSISQTAAYKEYEALKDALSDVRYANAGAALADLQIYMKCQDAKAKYYLELFKIIEQLTGEK